MPRKIRSRPYEVGFGRPPLETRFPPGRSGNPKGRPKKPRTLVDTLMRALNEPISFREGEHVKRARVWDVIVRSLVAKALKGDLKAISQIQGMVQTAELQNSAQAEAYSAERENAAAFVRQKLDQMARSMAEAAVIEKHR